MGSAMLRRLGVHSRYTFVLVPPAQPRFSQPVCEEDLPALTALYPVVVSDDEQGAVTLLKLILEYKAHLTVIGCTSGEQTLQLCDMVTASLVISDVMKPDMDGYEMLHWLREQPHTHYVPFMFLTARGDQSSHKKGLALGADRYLSKPLLHHDMVAEVTGLLMERYRKVAVS
ncbi:MAG TPA: response regulator [Aggregatilineaceae bacterium]|nr:response regulator [Aggregatilineaceae bacterium]